MIKYLSAFVVAVALSACSSGSSDSDTTGGTGTDTGGTGGTGGGTDTGSSTGTTTGVSDGGAIEPTGDIAGVWFGRNNFGEGVMVIDASENVYAFAANGAGNYETVFGPSSGELLHFIHRDSDNPASAESFTLAGDPADADANTAYNLVTQNDGQEIAHTGAGGNFTMTFANQDNLQPISVESVAGTWGATSSFCISPPNPTPCDIGLEMTFSGAGGVSGFTTFNNGEPNTLAGELTAAPDATQYLNVSFLWLGKSRTGVVHLDPRDPNRLMLNTFGPADTEGLSESFSASMFRR